MSTETPTHLATPPPEEVKAPEQVAGQATEPEQAKLPETSASQVTEPHKVQVPEETQIPQVAKVPQSAPPPEKAEVPQSAAPPEQAKAPEAATSPEEVVSEKAKSPTAAEAVKSAPDPDEDDLSDLDDVLDEFAATHLSSKTTAHTSSTAAPASSIPSDPFAAAGIEGVLPTDDDEFTRSLQAGMAELLGDLESNPEMQKQFEDLVKELGEGVTAASAGGIDPPSSGSRDILEGLGAGGTGEGAKPTTAEAQKAEASFQAQIKATMERMSASSAAATDATASSAANPDDFLSAMLAEMEKSGGDPSSLLGGAGGGGDEDFSKLLLGMMEQLTNKDILYEPMKELHDKFPSWMEINKETCDKKDLERYLEQQRLVGEIVGKFEESGYSDGKVEYREYIVDRMQKMQAAGSPPPDLVGDMNAAQEALDGMDQGCAQQ